MKLPRGLANIPAWLGLAVWKNDGLRASVGAGWLELRQHPDLLADIAIRGKVFAPFDETRNVDIQEGRRQLAVEIINLTTIDPNVIARICFQPLKAPETRR